MLLKSIQWATLIGIGVAASSAAVLAQINRPVQPSLIGASMPCPMASQGMMGHGKMMHMNVTSEFDYLSQMIPHHQEAVDTAQMILVRSDRPEMKAFAKDIIRVQNAEIQQMRVWLQTWYPGQKSSQPYQPMMRDLNTLRGNELDQAFLQDMVVHHMGAIHASQMLINGNLIQHNAIRPFAGKIASSQMQEIHQMHTWLKDWFGTTGMMNDHHQMH